MEGAAKIIGIGIVRRSRVKTITGILIAALGLNGLFSTALSAETVVMACVRGGGETFIVKSFSSTPGTPAVAKGYSCAETLGILYSLGFETVNAVPYTEGTQGGTLYTLVQR
jgi:hypothetical protein